MFMNIFAEGVEVTRDVECRCPHGHVLIRLGPNDIWKYFDMDMLEFIEAVRRGILPPPKRINNVVTIVGYTDRNHKCIVREIPLAKCPRAILDKLIGAGLLSHHEILMRMS